jgi:hypothetical protein
MSVCLTTWSRETGGLGRRNAIGTNPEAIMTGRDVEKVMAGKDTITIN